MRLNCVETPKKSYLNTKIALHIFKKKNEVKKCLKFDFAYLTTKLLGKPFNGSS
jgi:hypothetical protein